MALCSHCGFTNADHARFCAQCGTLLAAERATDDPLIGQEIAGRFRIARVLGEGGMGRVYLAHQRMGTALRDVAIKILSTNLADSGAIARFHRECETVVSLTHPNTIRFYDFGAFRAPTGEERLFIAMEYVDGRSLAKAIAAGPLHVEEVDGILRQVGGALSEAHRRGIIHRDLKPDNVLLARSVEEGEIPKVCDFGIAKNEGARGSEITAQGTIIGTPAYMSPEQFSGMAIDERADVYALALIVYEMLTGRRPFAAQTPLEWATAHLTGEPIPFDQSPATRGLSQARRDAIARALAKDPAHRTASVRRFVEEFTGTSTGLRTPSTRGAADPEAAMGHAVTMPATPAGPMTPYPVSGPSTTTRGSRWGLAPTLAGVLVLGALGGAIVLAIHQASIDAPDPIDVTDAGIARAIDAGLDAGRPEEPNQWVAILHYEDRAADATLALGPPDGRCARIQPRGTITLELAPGFRVETDGDDAPDLRVYVAGEATTGYRVDVGVERHQFTTIAEGVVSSIPLDVDQFTIPRFRYVRIKNRERRGEVCIDAVGVWRKTDS